MRNRDNPLVPLTRESSSSNVARILLSSTQEEEGSEEEERVVPQTVNQRLLAQIAAQVLYVLA